MIQFVARKDKYVLWRSADYCYTIENMQTNKTKVLSNTAYEEALIVLEQTAKNQDL